MLYLFKVIILRLYWYWYMCTCTYVPGTFRWEFFSLESPLCTDWFNWNKYVIKTNTSKT